MCEVVTINDHIGGKVCLDESMKVWRSCGGDVLIRVEVLYNMCLFRFLRLPFVKFCLSSLFPLRLA